MTDGARVAAAAKAEMATVVVPDRLVGTQGVFKWDLYRRLARGESMEFAIDGAIFSALVDGQLPIVPRERLLALDRLR